jgi:hypothetical protein
LQWPLTRAWRVVPAGAGGFGATPGGFGADADILEEEEDEGGVPRPPVDPDADADDASEAFEPRRLSFKEMAAESGTVRWVLSVPPPPSPTRTHARTQTRTHTHTHARTHAWG